MNAWPLLFGLLFLAVPGLGLPSAVRAGEDAPAQSVSPQLKLEQAAVCEGIAELKPFNPGITFSIENGRIMCFTRFAAVASETYILHRWFRRDELVSEKKLVLKPPRWSTYSSMQLRESDKGPWRIDIVDSDGEILAVLRFSVTK